MSKQILKRESAILEASVVGYFYNYGKKYDRCRHVFCGYEHVQNYSCYVKKAKLKTKTDFPPSKSEIQRHRGCSLDWCRTYYGARPVGGPIPPSKPVKCKRTYFRSYTTQELANPNTKVELVAIQLDVAGYYSWPHLNVVAVYDLMNDKWHDSKWWSTTPKGDLSLRAPCSLDLKPSEIDGIDEVIAKVKAGI